MALDATATDGTLATAPTTIGRSSGELCDAIEDVTANTTAGAALAHLKAGYERFLKGLHPDDSSMVHAWSFMRPAATLAIGAEGETGKHDLPSGFSGLDEPFYFPYTADVVFPTLSERSPEEVAAIWRNADSIDSDYPYAFAVVPKTFDDATGQEYSVWFAPIPETAVTLSYRYIVEPAALLDSDGTYPLGGWMHSETLLHLALADWEAQNGGGLGVWEAKAREALLNSIRLDGRFMETSGPKRLNRPGLRRRR